jgi:catechol 2,3-dioxygenase-like lactoylglutathione lyase family enzyme
MAVTGLDHVALPTADAERLVRFYEGLGFGTEHVEEWRAGTRSMFSIVCGDQKVNVHPEQLVAFRGNPAYLRGPAAEPGCGDLCVVWEGGVDALLALLEDRGVRVLEGPVPRVGGRAGGTSIGISVYVRDPDENLLELISYDPADIEVHGGGTAY